MRCSYESCDEEALADGFCLKHGCLKLGLIEKSL